MQALYAAGLVDEWRLMTWPVILGSGKRLFPDAADDKTKLRLADCTTYANGVQLRVFRPAVEEGRSPVTKPRQLRGHAGS